MRRMNSDGTARVSSRFITGWMLEPSGAGCHVITEECQNGILGAIGSWYLRPMLLKGHQGWLESLKRVAEGGEPT